MADATKNHRRRPPTGQQRPSEGQFQHPASYLGSSCIDLTLCEPGFRRAVWDVGLKFETGEEIGEGLLLGGMVDLDGVQIDSMQPVEENDRVRAPEPQLDGRKVGVHELSLL